MKTKTLNSIMLAIALAGFCAADEPKTSVLEAPPVAIVTEAASKEDVAELKRTMKTQSLLIWAIFGLGVGWLIAGRR